MRDLFREMFFGFVAIAMLIEWIGADIYCLLFALDRVAEVLNISRDLAASHMMRLFICNGIAAIGASMAFVAIRYPQYHTLRRCGVIMTVLGLLMYASYQFWFASNHLGIDGRWIQFISLIYAGFGFTAAWLGRELMSPEWQLTQPVQDSTNAWPSDSLRPKQIR